ncbi:hypothetical protein CF319_g8032 [Tilletia indica]|nr:hypothetical protein CF319_g8032 [Tilletia indica]
MLSPESSALSTCSSPGLQPEPIPPLPPKFTTNPALRKILRQRCALPPSLVHDIRSLAANPTLGSALRERERSWYAPSIFREPQQDQSEQTASVSKSAVSELTNEDGYTSLHVLPVGAHAHADADEDEDRPLVPEEEGQAFGSIRRRLSQAGRTGAVASNSRQGTSEPAGGGQAGASQDSSSGKIPSIGPSPSLQARLANFKASLPPAFRSSNASSHASSTAHVSHGDCAVIQPTETRKIGPCSKILESRHCSDPNTSDKATESQDQLIVRLSITSMHAAGGRRRDGHNSTRDGAATPRVNQEVEVLASMPLAALGEAIVCPTRLLPSLSSGSSQTATPELNFIAANGHVYLPAESSEAERQASLRVSHGSGLIPSTSSTLAKDIGNIRLCDLSDLRPEQELFLLHCGSCTHLLTITQICLHTQSEPPITTYPRSIFLPPSALRNPMMSTMIKKRFHPNVLSPMMCGICDTWPGQIVLVGGADVRPYRPPGNNDDDDDDQDAETTATETLQGIGEDAMVCCAGCWKACGGEVELAFMDDEEGTSSKHTKGSSKTQLSAAARKRKGKQADAKGKLKISRIEEEQKDERWDALPIQ